MASKKLNKTTSGLNEIPEYHGRITRSMSKNMETSKVIDEAKAIEKLPKRTRSVMTKESMRSQPEISTSVNIFPKFN